MSKYNLVRKGLFRQSSDHEYSCLLNLKRAEQEKKHILMGMFCSALKDVLLQLKLLGSTCRKVEIKLAEADTGLMMAKKYNVTKLNIDEECHLLEQTNLKSNVYQMQKLIADRKLLKKVIANTYLELRIDTSFWPLREQVNVTSQLLSYRKTLNEQWRENKAKCRELRLQLRQKRNQNKAALYSLDQKIEELRTKNEMEDRSCYVASRYAENWEQSRTEQQGMSFDIENTEGYSRLNEMKIQFENEQHAHNELEMIIKIKLGDTLDEIDKWMAKYDNDIEEMDLKIATKKGDLHFILSRKRDLEKQIKKRRDIYRAWHRYKDKYMEEQKIKEAKRHAAIVVQSWWRGILVRLNLGPFKEPKKGKIRRHR